MAMKLQTIYQYFSNYTEKEIEDMICSLSLEDQSIIKARFGDDLHNPKTQENWDSQLSKRYYGCLLPKMKKILSRKTKNLILVEKEEGLEQHISLPGRLSELKTIDYSSDLLQLVKSGKSNREICETLGISSNQLYEELLKLKNKGIKCLRTYYSDGTIEYKSISKMKDLKTYRNDEQNKTIITDMKENNMKLLLISDLHFGNEMERMDLIDRAYNYCIKNGIHIILCGGDFIDGSFTMGKQKISDLYQQIEFFLKNYPQDKSILTFGVAGDHDMSAINKESLDIIEICNNLRHDIIIGGYNNTNINLKNDKIHMYHYISGSKMQQTNAPIVLHGHYHRYSIKIINQSLNITIPSLSDIIQPMPSALELNLSFTKGYIKDTIIKHLYFGAQDVVLSEATFDLLSGRNVNYEPIKNTKAYRKNLEQSNDTEKVLTKVNHSLS